MSPYATARTLVAALSATLLAMFALGSGPALAQDSPTVTIENQKADAGSAPNLAVQARDFEGVESFQFEIQFDPSTLSVDQAEDLVKNAERSFQVAGPEDRGEGELFVAFFQGANESPINVSDGTLFEINFTEFTGGRGDVTFNVSNSEVNGGIGTAFENGFVSDQGGAVTIGDASDAGLNQTVSVPLTGSDGIGDAEVGQFEFAVEYSESNLQFEGVSSNQTGLSDGDLIVDEGTGSVTIEGADLDLNNPSIDLSGDFLELEFTFLGESSDLQFQSTSAVRNTEGDPIAVNFSGGTVSGDSPVISIADQGVSVGEEVTVPVETNELQELGSSDISVSFNEASLTFERAENIIGSDFSASVTEPGTIEISGFDTEGANPADNGNRLVDLVFSVESGISSFSDEVALQFGDGSQVSNPAGEVYSATFDGGRLVVENPAISFSRTSVDYGSVQTGDTASETVTITNEATEAATLEGDVSLTSGSDAAYSITSGNGAYSLGPGEAQDVTVEYAPSEVSNPDEGVLQVTSNDPDNSSQDVSLTGQAEPVQVALNAQSLDLREGDTELQVENVTANAGNTIVVTTDNGDGDFSDETVAGSTTLEEDTDGGSVLVDVEGADPVDHAAHVSTDGTVGGVIETSDRAPVYATAQFDFGDETSVGETGTVTVDAVEILYQGEVGESQISVDLHEADREAGTIGAFIGVSQEDLAVNEVHEDVVVDIVEPVSPDEENPERIEDTIQETGDFFAMAHRGAAGTDADGERIPAQRPALATTTGPGTIGDFATVTVERERAVALNAQSLDLRESDTELQVENVIANQGDEILITTTDGDGDFSDEEVVGTALVEENLDGGSVLVDVEGADPVDHAAHVSTDGAVGGVVASSDRAPVYATAQFDFGDETSVGETGTVTVDAVEILYQGEVGESQISVDLHEADREAGTIGAFIGVSQEDLAVNEVHEDVVVDIVEPVSPDEENPERIEDTIQETGDFFAMAHRGAAGTDADGERIPAQRPALATTTGPGTIGDFATVTIEPADLAVNVSRGFEGGASNPADYELVALPGSTGVDVAETVTGSRGTNWRAALETGGNGGDGSLQSYGDQAFDFQAGRGVWVLAQDGWSFDGTVPAVSAADGTPSVPLQEGWNAISNPLQEDLVWADVRDASGLSEALFRWTGENGFQPVDTLRSAQENGEAYYTLNSEGAESLELVSSATSNSTLAANTAAEGESGSSSRTVELSATAGEEGVTSTVTVGMNPGAEEASSYRAPPSHFGGTALRIQDGDPVKSYMRMVAATDAETSRFDLSLQAEPGTSVEVSADDLPETAGPNFGVVLVDGNDTYDLRDGPATVTVGENSGSAGFQVRLGDAEKIAQQTAPDETRLRANYPNPFSEQTTIEYDVAEQSEVNIRVYNLLGQQVATLARGTKQAGTHQVDWRGQSLSSGKYFVRLEAGGTTDTKQITIVR